MQQLEEHQRQPQLLSSTAQQWQQTRPTLPLPQQHQQQHVQQSTVGMGNIMMVVSQATTANYGNTLRGFYQPQHHQQQQQQLAQYPVMMVTSSSHGLSLQRAAVPLSQQQQQQQQQQQLLLLPVALSTVAAERQDATTVAPPMCSHALTGSSWSHQAAQLQAMHTQQQQQPLQISVQPIVAASVYGGSAANNDRFGSTMFSVSSVAAAVAAAAAGDAMSDCSSWSTASVAEITCGMLPVPAPAKSAAALAAAAAAATSAEAAAAAGVACDADHLHHTLQQQLLLSDTTTQGSFPAAECWPQAADVACLLSPAAPAAAHNNNAPNGAQQLSWFAQSSCNSRGASGSIGLASRLAPAGPMLGNSSAFPCVNSSSGSGLTGSSPESSRVATTTEALSVALQGWQQQQPAWYPRATQPW
jgi:hypothetical protein